MPDYSQCSKWRWVFRARNGEEYEYEPTSLYKVLTWQEAYARAAELWSAKRFEFATVEGLINDQWVFLETWSR